MIYKCFNEKSLDGANTCDWSEALAMGLTFAIKSEIMSKQHLSDLATQQLAVKLRKPIIRQSEK